MATESPAHSQFVDHDLLRQCLTPSWYTLIVYAVCVVSTLVYVQAPLAYCINGAYVFLAIGHILKPLVVSITNALLNLAGLSNASIVQYLPPVEFRTQIVAKSIVAALVLPASVLAVIGWQDAMLWHGSLFHGAIWLIVFGAKYMLTYQVLGYVGLTVLVLAPPLLLRYQVRAAWALSYASLGCKVLLVHAMVLNVLGRQHLRIWSFVWLGDHLRWQASVVAPTSVGLGTFVFFMEAFSVLNTDMCDGFLRRALCLRPASLSRINDGYILPPRWKYSSFVSEFGRAALLSAMLVLAGLFLEEENEGSELRIWGQLIGAAMALSVIVLAVSVGFGLLMVSEYIAPSLAGTVDSFFICAGVFVLTSQNGHSFLATLAQVEREMGEKEAEEREESKLEWQPEGPGGTQFYCIIS